ncbi:site-specific recombinase, phage integrase family [Leptospira ryugenii]|uniref:Site-specific recombinase, phage integrase family n=1 Tax=Leptospira ryugenii TaxID=1917863 RepID=A0A2P2E3Q8_9LEPT|nr:site-specific integrase [Leptospira ryugenii]GBF51511.1 site-specific recombinase, phage integrase family [Leptospira ryugenii]
MLKSLLPLFPQNRFPEVLLSEYQSPLLSNDEVHKVLADIRKYNFEHYLILRLLIVTGLQLPELLQLKKVDIHWNEQSISLGNRKRLKERKVFVEKTLCRELFLQAQQFIDTDLLFPGRKGPREVRSIQKVLSKASQFLRKPLHIPLLRDSLALYFYAKGHSVEEIQRLLGHRSIKSTKTRLQLYENLLGNALNVNFRGPQRKAA